MFRLNIFGKKEKEIDNSKESKCEDDPIDIQIQENRAKLNNTLSKLSLENLKSRIGLIYYQDEGYLLMDLDLNKRIGYINIQSYREGIVGIKSYGVTPEYQKYGFSTLMLGLFCSNELKKLSRERNEEIIGVNFTTQLIKKNITNSTLKYFSVSDRHFSNPNMEKIWNSLHQKIREPHMDYNSTTSNLHIGNHPL